MRTSTLLLALSTALSMMVLTNVVGAEPGVGVCVAGEGFTFYTDDLPGAFVGANAGTGSESGVFTDRSSFEAECCAEDDEGPDCFAPVA